VKERRPDAQSERRLESIRREAERKGRVDAPGIRPAGAPFPQASPETGYYGLPLLKPPVWTWEIPLYFFAGGAAGSSALFAAAASLRDENSAVVGDARRIAAIGCAISVPLLISDLGRPSRFLNMLRVFKLQSPMSIGAWTLAAFGATSACAAFAPWKPARMIAGLAGAPLGLVMATYSGVLLGATAIPAWSNNRQWLPALFGASATAAAASILELRGHRDRALNALGFGAALAELVIEWQLFRPESRGSTAMTSALARLFSGPAPALLRLAGVRSKRARQAAAVCQLLGSLLTRHAWVEAGRDSASRSANLDDASG
jgi:hypothetical protein